MGEHDDMTLPQLDELLAALGTTHEVGLGEHSDSELAQAVGGGC